MFPEIYRATVAAGEQAGHLDAVLERLADYTESRDELRQKILGALLYPIVLTVMCLGIVSGLLVYVVPKVVEVFESAKGKLPLMTRVLIAFSDFLRDYGLWLVVALVLGGFGFARWLRNPDARRRFHAVLLTLPLVGRVVRGFNTARFTRTFSILTGSAVPVLEALRIAGQVVSNVPMREAVEAAAQRVREGAPIGRSLGQSKVFPPMTIHLISSGESSGELEDMLERAAVSQERELDGILAALVGLLGTPADRADGPVRDGHRVRDADADLRDEHADPLSGWATRRGACCAASNPARVAGAPGGVGRAVRGAGRPPTRFRRHPRDIGRSDTECSRIVRHVLCRPLQAGSGRNRFRPTDPTRSRHERKTGSRRIRRRRSRRDPRGRG